MSYMKCPTCKELFGNRIVVYDNIKKEIENSLDTDDEKQLRLQELVKSLNFKRYCCTAKFITRIDIINIVK